VKRNSFTFEKNGLYLTLQPILSPIAQTGLGTENVELIHAASLSSNGFSGYKFSAYLASHIQPPNKGIILNHISLFIKNNEAKNLWLRK